jgi:hypothetical protein
MSSYLLPMYCHSFLVLSLISRSQEYECFEFAVYECFEFAVYECFELVLYECFELVLYECFELVLYECFERVHISVLRMDTEKKPDRRYMDCHSFLVLSLISRSLGRVTECSVTVGAI